MTDLADSADLERELPTRQHGLAREMLNGGMHPHVKEQLSQAISIMRQLSKNEQEKNLERTRDK